MSNLRDQMAHLINPGSPPPERSHESEGRPLLRSFPNPSRYGSHQMPHVKAHAQQTGGQIKQYLLADVSTRWTDLTLIICSFISGLIDAGAYNAYECFCSMQTGNTVFAALSVSDLPVTTPTWAWTKSAISVLSFLVGSVVTGLFHRHLGARKRWVLATSFMLQAVFIAIAGVLVYEGASSGAPGHGRNGIATLPADPGFLWMDLIPIALLAFQASAKVIASRVLEFPGLPGVVLTTLYTDLVSDPRFFSAGLLGNAQRNRGLGMAVCYFFGATMGGVAASHSLGFSGGLYIAAGLQLATAIAWLFWRDDSEDEEEQEEERGEEDSIAPGVFG